MGKISPFGLMEISRQRRRTGVLEGTTHVCEHCAGTGRVRSVESSALATLRSLEIEALKGGGEATLRVPRAVGLYILNEKRAHLARLHQAFGLFVTVIVEDAMSHVEHAIERTSMETRPDHAVAVPLPVQPYAPTAEDEDEHFDEAFDEEDEDEEDEDALEAEDTDDDEAHARNAAREDARRDDDDDGARRGGRRRRRRGRRGDEPRPDREREPRAEREARPARPETDEERESRRRRRGRRGGRRMREDFRPQDAFSWVRPWVPYGDDPFVWYDPAEDLKIVAPTPAAEAPMAEARPAPVSAGQGGDDIWVELPEADDKSRRPRRGRGRGRGRGDAEAAPSEPLAVEVVAEVAPEPVAIPVTEPEPEPVAAEAPKPKRSRSRKAPVEAPAEAVAEAPAPVVELVVSAEPVAEPEPELAPRAPDPAEISGPAPAPRRGWWRRG
jgi:ribonuclease E